ncbi:hypothetical protein TWF281_001422 [Arthrobotrys megalospora]
MPLSHCHQEQTATTPPVQNTTTPRAQRWSTPVEPPSKNYLSPPRSRSRRHSTAEDISPTARLGSNGTGPQFRDVDWGDNGKMLRDRVSEITKCANDVERLVDGYLEEHSELQKKLKVQVKPDSISSTGTKSSKAGTKSQAVSANVPGGSSSGQLQSLKDRILELEKKIKYMEKNQQKETSERERANLIAIQKMDSSAKVEVESLQAQVADLNLKLQNKNTKVESLTDQKSQLVYEKDQLQSKLEHGNRQAERLQSKLHQKGLETHNFQAQVQRFEQERDEGIKQYNLVQDEVDSLRNIIRNCKYCASVWEFTQHRSSIDVNVWYCDINQEGCYILPSPVQTPVSQVDNQYAVRSQISGISDGFITENFKLLIHDVEKLCTLVAFRSAFLSDYIKKTDPEDLGEFKVCLQNNTLESEIFLAYLQREVWRVSLQLQSQASPIDTIRLEERIKERLKLHDAKTSSIPLDYDHLYSLISAIAKSFTNLFTILRTSPGHIAVSMDLLEAEAGLDLFPIIRRSDGALLLGHIPVKNIEENAIIMPITPIAYRQSLNASTPNYPTQPNILVNGTAIVYERKRSASFPRNPSITGKYIPSRTPKPAAQSRPPRPDAPTPDECAPNTPLLLSSFPKDPFVPLRPSLHCKPKLPPLDTTATTATPTNSPVLQRTTKPPPPIPNKNLIARTGSAKNSSIKVGEAKDSEAEEAEYYIEEAQKNEKDIITTDVVVAKNEPTSHQDNAHNKFQSGTPLAAIWRALEQLDKKNSSRRSSQ